MKWNFRVGGMGKNSFRDVVKALFYYEIYKDLSLAICLTTTLEIVVLVPLQNFVSCLQVMAWSVL